MKKAKNQPNYQLREARLKRGWTQDEEVDALYELAIAEGYGELKIDQRTISRWECGGYQPAPHHAFLLRKLHNNSIDQLGFSQRARNNIITDTRTFQLKRVRLDSMKRRNIMLGSAAAAALTNSYSVNPDHWERLSKVVRNSNGIGETAVAALESETAALKNLHTGISSAQLFPHIDTHLGHLADILNRPMPPSMRQRLITTTGRIASLGGWVAWDNGYPQAAHRLYRISIKASHEAGDPSVLAACLLNMSYMPSSGGNNLEAERMLGQGMEQMTPSSSPLIATWLEASRAEVVARRDDQAALPLLEKSFHRFSTITPNVGTSESTPITPARMDSFALNVNLHLGRHSDAEPIARRLLGATSPSSPLHPISLSDVATVYLKTGNFEEGTEIASKALSAAVNAQSRWAMSRLNNLYALLSERAAKDQRAAEITNQFKEYSNNSY